MIEAERFVDDFRGIIGNYYENANRESCFLAVAEKQDGDEGAVCAYAVLSEGSVPVTVNAVSRALGELVGSTVKDKDGIVRIASNITVLLVDSALRAYKERMKQGEAPAIEDEEDEGFIARHFPWLRRKGGKDK